MTSDLDAPEVVLYSVGVEGRRNTHKLRLIATHCHEGLTSITSSIYMYTNQRVVYVSWILKRRHEGGAIVREVYAKAKLTAYYIIEEDAVVHVGDPKKLKAS